MASELGNVVKAQRFNELKQKVREECKRRKYVGSVEQYGGTNWDFSNVPATDKEITQEHYEKISIPMRKINWQVTPNGPFNRIIKDEDLVSFETNYVAFRGRDIVDESPTDCSSSCTGTCTTSCTTGCGGSCDNTCTGCSGSCRGGCSNTCLNGCSGCGDECSSGCLGVCGTGCEGHCTTSCYEDGATCKNCQTSCSGGSSATETCNKDGCVAACQMSCGTKCGSGGNTSGSSCGGNNSSDSSGTSDCISTCSNSCHTSGNCQNACYGSSK